MLPVPEKGSDFRVSLVFGTRNVDLCIGLLVRRSLLLP